MQSIKHSFFYFGKFNPQLQFISKVVRYCLLRFLSKGDLYSKANDDEFVFIVGSGRSGNTLLRRLMMESLDIYFPPESYVIPKQIMNFYNSRGMDWKCKVNATLSFLEYHEEFETFNVKSLRDFAFEAHLWPKGKQTLYDLICGLYHWLAKENGFSSRVVGDKTPLNTLNLGVIDKAFPSAKYIYIERDPVDVASSYVQAGIYDDVTSAAKRWLDSHLAWERFKRIKHDEYIFELRYDDLVLNHERVISDISNKLKITRRNKCSGNVVRALGDVGSRLHHEAVLNKPSDVSIGKGRLSLSSLELNEISIVLGGLPEKIGYDRI